MERFNAEALLLDVFDLHDRDRLVTFLTREHGKKKGVARGARRKYSRFAGQLQPLAKVQVEWFEKAGRDLGRISQVELVSSAHRLQDDLEGILVGSYLAEHLKEFVQENESGELYFRLLESTLDALLAGVDRDLAARYFESWILRLSGIFPPPTECPSCGGSLDDGAVLPASGEALLCRRCAGATSAADHEHAVVEEGVGPGSMRVSPAAVELLQRMGRQRLDALAESPPSRALLREVEAISGRIRCSFLQGELRSYEVLQRTFDQLRAVERQIPPPADS